MTRQRFLARGDGKILVDIRQPMVVSVEEARALAKEATQAAHQAERCRNDADGSAYWIATQLPGSPNVRVAHRGVHRVFRPSKVRAAHRCNACGGRIAIGESAFVEQNPKQWATPNWRSVHLCEACVRPELRGRALLDRLSKLAGVGVQR